MQAPSDDQNGGDPEGASSKMPSKRSKQKMWERVSWFKRRSRSKDNVGDSSGSSSALSPRVSGHSDEPGSSVEGADIDFSPETSTSSSSPVPCRSLPGSGSSSEMDLYDSSFIDGSLVKRSKTNPNSEIVEQRCLRPSVARALFLQLESWMSKKDSPQAGPSRHSHKYSWPKKKSCTVKEDPDSDEVNMTRAVSMPGGIVTRSKCHCAACCSCTPRERLQGWCPAHVKLSTSTTSLDTGLATLGFSPAYNPLIVESLADDPGDDFAAASTSQDGGSQTTAVAALEPAKCNSLPSNPGQSTCRECPTCGKYIPTIPLPPPPSCDIIHGVTSTEIGIPPSCPQLEYCHCPIRNPTAWCSQAVGHNDNTSSSSRSTIDENNPKVRNHSGSQRVCPSEFKERTDVIKQWFSEFSDEQKNLALKQLLTDCDLPQLHMLSLEMESRLHANCPINCHDRLSWLPQTVSLIVLFYLDPVSLCHASAVCRGWAQLANEPSLWRRFCGQSKWRLSMAGEQKQLLHHMKPDGTIQWKKVFAERYRLRNNWIKGKCNVRTFEGHHQGISCVQFDDTRIVSGSSDKTIKVWNIRTNNPWAVQTLVGHSGTVRCLHLDGNRLVSGSTDGSIKVWDLSTQQSWSSIACKVTMVGHTGTVRCLQVDEEKVISGSYDKTLKVWDMKTGVCRMTLHGHDAAVLCVQFDDSKIISGSCDKTIKVWNFEGQCMMTLEGHHDAVTCLQFDKSRIFSGSLDCNLKFWDIVSGNCINTIDWKASEGHTGVVRCLQADSWRVVSASDDRTLKVWSLETGQRLVTLRNHTDGVTCLQFNDSIIVSGSYDKTVKLWDFSCC